MSTLAKKFFSERLIRLYPEFCHSISRLFIVLIEIDKNYRIKDVRDCETISIHVLYKLKNVTRREIKDIMCVIGYLHENVYKDLMKRLRKEKIKARRIKRLWEKVENFTLCKLYRLKKYKRYIKRRISEIRSIKNEKVKVKEDEKEKMKEYDKEKVKEDVKEKVKEEELSVFQRIVSHFR
jgi:hypothetical protein